MRERDIRHYGAASAVALVTAISVFAASAAQAQPETSAKPRFFPSIFLFSDTSISYWHQFTAREPNLLYPAQKDIITLRHVDAWRYGQNFLSIDLIKSNNKDPEAPWAGPHYPVPPWGIGVGAFEFYGLYRGSLSFNQMFDTVAFTFGPVRDVSLYFGGDINSKNTAMAPRKKDILFGLEASLAVPGYLNLSASLYKEWNHNGIVALQGYPPGTSSFVNYAATVAFEAQYMQPLAFTGLPLKVSGRSFAILPKGTDGFGRWTLTEVQSENRLTLDLGKLVADRPNLVDVFAGYRIWVNKFGDNPYPPRVAPVAGTMESTFFLGVTWHVF